MHIPKNDTAQETILPFAEALAESEQPHPHYDVGQWLYVPNTYSEYRYVLGTRGAKPLICIGINPSTAEPDHLDNTLKSVQRIALGNGFDSFIMFNVYAQRATVPDDMEATLNPLLHAENMKAFEYVLSLSDEPPTVWAAWGTIIKKRAYLPACVRDMIAVGKRFSAKWVSTGACSKVGGHPHHPLYLRKDSLLDAFDVEAYLQSLNT